MFYRQSPKKVDMRQIWVFIVLASISCLQAEEFDNIVINEFVASNIHSDLAPDTKNFEDWIELYNPEEHPVNLGGLYLTDDLDTPFKWRIPDWIVIEPKAFIVFWADGKDFEMHTNFKLNDQGEELVLFQPDGRAIDWIDFGEQTQDISFGRYPDGTSSWYYIANPTPGRENESLHVTQLNQAAEPVFSKPGGLYSQGQSVTLTASQGSTIRFTTDGSIPTELSQSYSSAIDVNTTTVIRAKTFAQDMLPSPMATNTYIINRTSTLPVISIAADPNDLFDESIGITSGLCFSEPPGTEPPFDMTANYWQDWERPVSFEYFEPDGKLGFKLDAGISIFGGAFGRQICQKAFSIYARDKYGFNAINYRIFPTKSIDKFKRFILRASSNDYNRTFFRDAMMNTLLIGQMDVDYQAYQPAIAFINGRFWGIYNIREKTSKYYPESNYGIDANNVDLLENIDEVSAGDNADYKEMIAFVQSHDMSQSANYEHIKNLIDVGEFMNYFIAQLYFRNHDWLGRNTKYWRRQNPEGKWRWILFDLDWGFGGEVNEGPEQYSTNSLQWAFDTGGAVLLEHLLQNLNFRNEFVQRFASHLNITFNLERVIQIIDKLKAGIEPEMPAHIARWGWPRDIAAWENEIDLLREFASLRPDFVREHLNMTLHLNGLVPLLIHIVNPGMGTVKVNSVDIPQSGFEGLYYRDIPIRLEAIPRTGYKFVHWEGLSNTASDSISLWLSDFGEIAAIFEPSETPAIVINEIHYNPSGELQGSDDYYEFIELLNQGIAEVDISNYFFNKGIEFKFPTGTLMAPGEYIVVARNKTCYEGNGFQVFQFTEGALANEGETISLYDDSAVLIDSVEYNDTAPWATLPDGNGPSLELIGPDFDNSLAGSWAASPQTGGTPGRANLAATNP
jgi:hypothetical protein